jgi:hypothetical protein
MWSSRDVDIRASGFSFKSLRIVTPARTTPFIDSGSRSREWK